MTSQVVEEREIGFEFSWRVSRAERDEKQFDESILSPVFATVNNGIRYLWALDLHPKGYKTANFPSADKQPNVSLFLWLKEGSAKESVEAKYQLFIWGGTTQRQKKTQTFHLSVGWGSHAFCPQNEIETAEWVEFGARIWLKESVFNVSELFPDPQFLNFHRNQLLYEQIVLGDHSLGSLIADVSIVVSNGPTLPCLQLFLCQASPVFHAMFQQPWVEGQQKQIHIDDVRLETLKQLLFFFFVDGMPEGWEANAEGLLRAAHKYDVEKVVVKCEKELAKRLELGNAVEMLLLAMELNLKLLEMQATQMLIDNWGQEFPKEEALKKLGLEVSVAIMNGFAHQKNVTVLHL